MLTDYHAKVYAHELLRRVPCCCSTFKVDPIHFLNLTVKKIPKAPPKQVIEFQEKKKKSRKSGKGKESSEQIFKLMSPHTEVKTI